MNSQRLSEFRHIQDQESPTFSMGGGGAHEIPYPAEKLLATDGLWKMVTIFSSGVGCLKDYTCSICWFYIHAIQTSLSGLSRLKKERRK